jgi:hypothetical protein
MKVTARQPRLWAPSGRISIHSPAPAGGPQNVTAVAPTGAVQVARGAGGCGYPEHPRLYPGSRGMPSSCRLGNGWVVQVLLEPDDVPGADIATPVPWPHWRPVRPGEVRCCSSRLPGRPLPG